MILNYQDFILEENREHEYYLSNRLSNIIRNMRVEENTTSNRRINFLINSILATHNNTRDNITFIDSTDKNETLSFFPLDKLFQVYYEEKKLTSDRNFKKIDDDTYNDFIEWIPWTGGDDFKNSESWIWNNTKRTDINAGRLFIKILTKAKVNFEQSEIEKLVNLYKSSYDKLNGKKFFELVEGDDILKYYHEKNYDVNSGDLSNSCMRYEKCQKFLNIYTKNPNQVKLLVLKLNPDSEKIIGRSLIWKLDNGKYYMDRVYTSFSSDIDLYRKYAKENSYLDYYDDDSELVVSLENFDFKYYPYMDSMIYLDIDSGKISNRGEGRELQCTDGTWNDADDDENYVYSERYGERIERDNAVWCEDLDDYCYIDDSYYLEYKNCWVSDRADVVSSNETGDYYLSDDAVRSEYLDDWILSDDSISILKSSDMKSYDYISTAHKIEVVKDCISNEDTIEAFCYKITLDDEIKYYFRDWIFTLVATDKYDGIRVSYNGDEWTILESMSYRGIYDINSILHEVDHMEISIIDYINSISKSISYEEYLKNLIEKSKASIEIVEKNNLYPFNNNKLLTSCLAYCFASPNTVKNNTIKDIFSNDDLLKEFFDPEELNKLFDNYYSYQVSNFISFLQKYEKYSSYFIDSPDMISFYKSFESARN
jgi:hypothetical protein